MTLTIPEYLQLPGIQETTIRYPWDDWNVEEVDLPLEEALQERLHRISQRAVAAFTIGTAEWVAYRFGKISADAAPAEHLEAAWAQVVDIRYSALDDINLENWRGPVRGPIGISLRRVIFALDQAQKDGDPAWRAGRASKLAEHVITDPSPYRIWRNRILERLERLYPLDPDEKLGEVVPREAMDPGADFVVSQTETLINRFLAGLNYRSNRFLCSPDEMLKRGFEGTPYFFSIAADRKARYEW